MDNNAYLPLLEIANWLCFFSVFPPRHLNTLLTMKCSIDVCICVSDVVLSSVRFSRTLWYFPGLRFWRHQVKCQRPFLWASFVSNTTLKMHLKIVQCICGTLTNSLILIYIFFIFRIYCEFTQECFGNGAWKTKRWVDIFEFVLKIIMLKNE